MRAGFKASDATIRNAGALEPSEPDARLATVSKATNAGEVATSSGAGAGSLGLATAATGRAVGSAGVGIALLAKKVEQANTQYSKKAAEETLMRYIENRRALTPPRYRYRYAAAAGACTTKLQDLTRLPAAASVEDRLKMLEGVRKHKIELKEAGATPEEVGILDYMFRVQNPGAVLPPNAPKMPVPGTLGTLAGAMTMLLGLGGGGQAAVAGAAAVGDAVGQIMGSPQFWRSVNQLVGSNKLMPEDLHRLLESPGFLRAMETVRDARREETEGKRISSAIVQQALSMMTTEPAWARNRRWAGARGAAGPGDAPVAPVAPAVRPVPRPLRDHAATLHDRLAPPKFLFRGRG
eukprot:tig00000249_g22154.t1